MARGVPRLAEVPGLAEEELRYLRYLMMAREPVWVRQPRAERFGYWVLVAGVLLLALSPFFSSDYVALGAFERWVATGGAILAAGVTLILAGLRQRVKLQESENAGFKAVTDRAALLLRFLVASPNVPDEGVSDSRNVPDEGARRDEAAGGPLSRQTPLQ